jgi:tripartite-type tricarboxylate transporter receptor subunit TctC
MVSVEPPRRLAMIMCPRFAPAVFAAALLWPGLPAQADDFYKGRTIDLYIGTTTGGGYDGYGRLVGRHIGHHIPGQPTVVIRNMPGASGLALANWFYSSAAPHDGSAIAILHNNMTVEPVIGNKNARFDATKFNWLGSANKLVNTCVAWHTVPVRTIEDLRNHEWLTGGTAARSSTVQQANVFIVLGGAKLKVVKGYPSSTSMLLALERGELEIACGIGYDSIKSSTGMLQAGKIVPVMQLGYEKHPELPNVPFIYDMLLDPSMKPVLDFLTIRLYVGRAFATPPDVPAERIKLLRTAFWATINDPALRADAEKQHMEVQPVRGEDIQREVERLAKTPRDIVAVADKVLENEINVFDAKLNWIDVRGSTLTDVQKKGRIIAFADRGKPVKADTNGSKITIAGKAAKRADLKAGLVCDISYLGNNDQARTIACH